MPATATSPPTTEQPAAHSADQAWSWDGSRWQPTSTEVPVGHDLRRRLRTLALPLYFIPGHVALLLFLATLPGLWLVVAILGLIGQDSAFDFFMVTLLVPLLAVPLLLLRFLMGPGQDAYRHDLTASTFWRSRGHPRLVPPATVAIASWRLRPVLDGATVRTALSGMQWAEVDHGAAGAVVYAIRDRSGRTVYELARGGLARAVLLWAFAVAAVAWTLVVSGITLDGINTYRSGFDSEMRSAQGKIDELSAAIPCPKGVSSSRTCVVLSSAIVNDLNPSNYGCAADLQFADNTISAYQLVSDCALVPDTGSQVTVRQWNGKVVDISYVGQRFDTIDSPDIAYDIARAGRDGAQAVMWLWTLAPIAYLILVGAGYLAWRLDAPRRHARYAKRYSQRPRPPR